MIDVFRSTVFDAPRERVWQIVRPFDALHIWMSAAVSTIIEDGASPDCIGCVRRCIADDGSTVRQRLVALSDADFSCTYKLLSAEYPMRDYWARFDLFEVTDGNRCYMTWRGVFHAAAHEEQQATDFVGDKVFMGGFKRIREILADAR